MGIFLRNNWYYFKKQIEGKVYRKSLRIRKGQEYLLSARLRQVEEEILAHHFGLNYSPRKEITFLEFKERYRELKKYKKTLKLDLRRLEIMNECLNNPLLSQISKREIEKLENFLLERERIEKETTVNRYFSLLKHFLNLAIEEGFLKENPVVKYYRTFVESSERRALTKREIRKVLSAAKEIQKNPRSQTQRIIFDLILFALNTGMRLSEILNLKKSQIKENLVFLPVIETKWRRRGLSSKKVKIVTLNEIAQKIIERQNSKDDYVFPLIRRKVDIVKRSVNRIRKLTNIQDFTFHTLRHTVSTLISTEYDLATAKAVLGHADIRTTLKYAHPELRRQREAVSKLCSITEEILKEDIETKEDRAKSS